MNTIRRISLMLAVAMSIPIVLAAQEVDSTSAYAIASVDFRVQGRPLVFVLRDKVDIPIGKTFQDKDSLEAYLQDRRQILMNERTLQSVDVSYDQIPSSSGPVEVAVHFTVKESWNIIALPKPTYDSNTGLLLSVRARDYDFVGSMQSLSLDLNYTYDQFGRSGFGGAMSFTVPFVVGNLEAAIGASSDLTIYADGTPMNSSSNLSFSLTDERFGFPITYSLSQGLVTNPDSVSNDSDPYYLTDSATASASFALLGGAGILGNLSYAPSLSLSQMWRFEAPVRSDRQGPVVTFSHTLSWGRVDWIGNMKQGLTVSVSNSDYLYLRDDSVVSDVDASTSAYAIIWGPFAVKSRLQLFDRPIGGRRSDVGGSMRGIFDSRIDGVAGAFLNLDMPIRLFDFPTHVLIGKDWLDFQAQASPFLDFGEVLPEYGSRLSASTTWLSGGLEGYAFPLRMRSFIVRASLGFDILHFLETHSLTATTSDGYKPYEFYFGLGLLY